jgi:plastocyanin
MRPFAVLPAGLAVVVVVLAGCGGSSSSGSKSGGQKTIAGLSANDHGTKQASSSGATQVELKDFYFNPTVIKGKPGAKLTLALKNDGSVEHNLTIDSQHVNQNIQPGKEATVTVTIPKTGEVSFYCKFHKSSGMAGALEASG